MTQEELQEEIDKRLPDELQLGRNEIAKGLVQLFNQHVAEVIGEDVPGFDTQAPISSYSPVIRCDCGHININIMKAYQRKRAGL